MLTDDDLTRDLRAAFHETADDLTYDGPVPAGPRTPVWARVGWVALPAAAAVAATVVVAGSDPAADVTTPPTAAPSPDLPAPTPAVETVTDEIEVLGMTISYERPATSEPYTFTLSSPDSVPDGAREVTFPGMAPARAWVTTVDGEAVLYLDAPTRNNGHLMAMSSPDLDEAALVDILRYGDRS